MGGKVYTSTHGYRLATKFISAYLLWAYVIVVYHEKSTKLGAVHAIRSGPIRIDLRSDLSSLKAIPCIKNPTQSHCVILELTDKKKNWSDYNLW